MGSMIYAVDVMRDDTARMDTAAEAVEEGSGALGWVAPLDCTELLAAAANSTTNRTSGPTNADADAAADAAIAAAVAAVACAVAASAVANVPASSCRTAASAWAVDFHAGVCRQQASSNDYHQTTRRVRKGDPVALEPLP